MQSVPLNEALLLSLEEEARGYADERHALNVVIAKKTLEKQCCEQERLAHNVLITRELRADRERMKIVMLMRRPILRETKYT